MGIKEEPHYQISAAELADWLKRRGDESWWTVDGDPLLMGQVPFPCPAEDLAEAIGKIAKPLLVLGSADQRGQAITAADLDRIAIADEDGNRLLTLSWANRADAQEWVLAEDREAARVGTAVLSRATGS